MRLRKHRHATSGAFAAEQERLGNYSCRSRLAAVPALAFCGEDAARTRRALKSVSRVPPHPCSRCGYLGNPTAAFVIAKRFHRHAASGPYGGQKSFGGHPPSRTPNIRHSGSNQVSSQYAVKTHSAFPDRRGERPSAANSSLWPTLDISAPIRPKLSLSSSDNRNGQKANLSLSCFQLASIRVHFMNASCAMAEPH